MTFFCSFFWEESNILFRGCLGGWNVIRIAENLISVGMSEGLKLGMEMWLWSVKIVGKRVGLKTIGTEWVWYSKSDPKYSMQM